MKNCPHCDPSKPKQDPFRESQCVLRKPLMMVIPPEGAHLSCPIHPDGHHIFGSQTYCESYPEPKTWNGTYGSHIRAQWTGLTTS